MLVRVLAIVSISVSIFLAAVFVSVSVPVAALDPAFVLPVSRLVIISIFVVVEAL